jgi:hypothetical protein
MFWNFPQKVTLDPDNIFSEDVQPDIQGIQRNDNPIKRFYVTFFFLKTREHGKYAYR